MDSCVGCAYVAEEHWKRNRVDLFCMAEGPHKGWMIGVNHHRGFIPAWCPGKKEEKQEYRTTFRERVDVCVEREQSG